MHYFFVLSPLPSLLLSPLFSRIPLMALDLALDKLLQNRTGSESERPDTDTLEITI